MGTCYSAEDADGGKSAPNAKNSAALNPQGAPKPPPCADIHALPKEVAAEKFSEPTLSRDNLEAVTRCHQLLATVSRREVILVLLRYLCDTGVLFQEETCPAGIVKTSTFERYFALPARISEQLLRTFAGDSVLGIDLPGFTALCAHCCAENRAVRRAFLFNVFAEPSNGVLELNAESLQDMLEVPLFLPVA